MPLDANDEHPLESEDEIDDRYYRENKANTKAD